VSRSHPSADEIAEQLMDLVIGLKRRVQADYAGQTLPYPQHAVLKRLDKGGSATTADLRRKRWAGSSLCSKKLGM
jgi:hypothetical protein